MVAIVSKSILDEVPVAGHGPTSYRTLSLSFTVLLANTFLLDQHNTLLSLSCSRCRVVERVQETILEGNESLYGWVTAYFVKIDITTDRQHSINGMLEQAAMYDA